MQVSITQSRMGGRLPAIPSKSSAQRLLLAAGLSDGVTRIGGLLERSKDIEAMIGCLRACNIAVSEEGAGGLLVNPTGVPPAAPHLHCGESGATLRMILPVAAALFEEASFAGEGRLPARPMAALLNCMKENGAAADREALPIRIKGRLRPGEYAIAGDESSQYISGLLFALPLLQGESRIRLTAPLQSAGYVQMTLDVLLQFGVRVQFLPDGYLIPGGQRYHTPGEAAPEGDWSNAAFFLAAGALHAPVTVEGLDARSAQPDRAMAGLLRRFGADVKTEGDAVTVLPAPLRGIEMDMSQAPDLLPILAVLGACAQGETRLFNAARLRIKESDRLASVADMLQRFGARVQEQADALIITGGPLYGGRVDCYNDHRIAMAAAIAASRAEGESVLLGAEAVDKSYHAYFQDFNRLGGRAHVQ